MFQDEEESKRGLYDDEIIADTLVVNLTHTVTHTHSHAYHNHHRRLTFKLKLSLEGSSLEARDIDGDRIDISHLIRYGYRTL